MTSASVNRGTSFHRSCSQRLARNLTRVLERKEKPNFSKKVTCFVHKEDGSVTMEVFSLGNQRKILPLKKKLTISEMRSEDIAIHGISQKNSAKMANELRKVMTNPSDVHEALSEKIEGEEQSFTERFENYLSTQLQEKGLSDNEIEAVKNAKPAALYLGHQGQETECYYPLASENNEHLETALKKLSLERLMVEFFQKELGGNIGLCCFHGVVPEDKALKEIFGNPPTQKRKLFWEYITYKDVLRHGIPHVPNFFALYRYIQQQKDNPLSAFYNKEITMEQFHHFYYTAKVETNDKKKTLTDQLQDKVPSGCNAFDMTSPFHANTAYCLMEDSFSVAYFLVLYQAGLHKAKKIEEGETNDPTLVQIKQDIAKCTTDAEKFNYIMKYMVNESLLVGSIRVQMFEEDMPPVIEILRDNTVKRGAKILPITTYLDRIDPPSNTNQ